MTLPELVLRSKCMAKIRARHMIDLIQCMVASGAATTGKIKSGRQLLKGLLKQLEKQANG